MHFNGHTPYEHLEPFRDVKGEFYNQVCGIIESSFQETENHMATPSGVKTSSRGKTFFNRSLPPLEGSGYFHSRREVDFPSRQNPLRVYVCSCSGHDDDELAGVTAKLRALTTILEDDNLSSRGSSDNEVNVQVERDQTKCFPCRREFLPENASVDHLQQTSRLILGLPSGTETLLQSPQSLRGHQRLYREEEIGQGCDDDEDICCYLCIEPFDSLLDKLWHEYDQHLTCSVCFKVCASRNDFDEHVSKSKGHNFCFECNLNFRFREQLAQHRRCTKHTTPYNCLPIMSDVGVKKKVHVCDKCHDYEGDDIFLKFATEQELQKHIDIIHNTCTRCDMDFISRQDLTEHIMESSRHHYCSDCDYDFPSKPAFDMHCRMGLHMD